MSLQAFSLQGRLKRRESQGPYSLGSASWEMTWLDSTIVSQICTFGDVKEMQDLEAD